MAQKKDYRARRPRPGFSSDDDDEYTGVLQHLGSITEREKKKTQKLTEIQEQKSKKNKIHILLSLALDTITVSPGSCPGSSLAQTQRNPSKQPIHGYNPHQDPSPFPGPARRIPVCLEHARPADLALRCQVRHVHALALRAARVRPLREFIDHHALEDIRLFPGIKS